MARSRSRPHQRADFHSLSRRGAPSSDGDLYPHSLQTDRDHRAVRRISGSVRLCSCVGASITRLSRAALFRRGYDAQLSLSFFHPWDHPSLLCWLIGAMFIRDDRFVPLMFLIPIAVTVKWDIIVLPSLYWLAHCSRDSFKLVTLRTLALGGVAIATLLVLAKSFPGGSDRLETASLWDITRWQVSHNWQEFLALHISYPPLLVFGLPLVFASYGFRQAGRFLRVSCLFGVALFIPLVLNSFFIETRAQMMILALLLPTALIGLSQVLELDRRVTGPARGQ